MTALNSLLPNKNYENHSEFSQAGMLIIPPNALALAPMAGVTSSPFRILAKEQGCHLLYSEMISAKGLLNSRSRREHLLCYSEYERPLAFQLFGSEPELIARAASLLESIGADYIDLNFGCPTKKIIRNGDGGALLLNPQLCSNIFKAVITAVNCPVTVKIRKGWDDKSINALEIAARAEQAGIKAIAVHGRTVKQGYRGTADWQIIRQVKESVSIPVIGNGDVNTAQAAEKLFKESGCDAVMIGRAARGNPWIFKEVNDWLQNKTISRLPTRHELIDMVIRHYSMMIEFKGEKIATAEMRRHAAWYLKSIHGSASARAELVRSNSLQETEDILRKCLLKQ